MKKLIEQNKIKIDYEFSGSNDYLIVNVADSGDIVNYQLQMMSNNDTESFLPVKKLIMNNSVQLFYNVSNRVTLSQSLKNQKFEKRAFLNFMISLIRGIIDASELGLEDLGIVLDKKYIFLEDLNSAPKFVYLPFYKDSVGASLVAEFLKGLADDGCLEENYKQEYINIIKIAEKSGTSYEEVLEFLNDLILLCPLETEQEPVTEESNTEESNTEKSNIEESNTEINIEKINAEETLIKEMPMENQEIKQEISIETAEIKIETPIAVNELAEVNERTEFTEIKELTEPKIETPIEINETPIEITEIKIKTPITVDTADAVNEITETEIEEITTPKIQDKKEITDFVSINIDDLGDADTSRVQSDFIQNIDFLPPGISLPVTIPSSIDLDLGIDATADIFDNPANSTVADDVEFENIFHEDDKHSSININKIDISEEDFKIDISENELKDIIIDTNDELLPESLFTSGQDDFTFDDENLEMLLDEDFDDKAFEENFMEKISISDDMISIEEDFEAENVNDTADELENIEKKPETPIDLDSGDLGGLSDDSLDSGLGDSLDLSVDESFSSSSSKKDDVDDMFGDNSFGGLSDDSDSLGDSLSDEGSLLDDGNDDFRLSLDSDDSLFGDSLGGENDSLSGESLLDGGDSQMENFFRDSENAFSAPKSEEETPKTELKGMESKETESQETETPKIELEKIESEKTETPKVELEKNESEKTETSKVESEKIESEKTETKKTETPKVPEEYRNVLRRIDPNNKDKDPLFEQLKNKLKGDAPAEGVSSFSENVIELTETVASSTSMNFSETAKDSTDEVFSPMDDIKKDFNIGEENRPSENLETEIGVVNREKTQEELLLELFEKRRIMFDLSDEGEEPYKPMQKEFDSDKFQVPGFKPPTVEQQPQQNHSPQPQQNAAQMQGLGQQNFGQQNFEQQNSGHQNISMQNGGGGFAQPNTPFGSLQNDNNADLSMIDRLYPDDDREITVEEILNEDAVFNETALVPQKSSQKKTKGFGKSQKGLVIVSSDNQGSISEAFLNSGGSMGVDEGSLSMNDAFSGLEPNQTQQRPQKKKKPAVNIQNMGDGLLTPNDIADNRVISQSNFKNSASDNVAVGNPNPMQGQFGKGAPMQGQFGNGNPMQQGQFGNGAPMQEQKGNGKPKRTPKQKKSKKGLAFPNEQKNSVNLPKKDLNEAGDFAPKWIPFIICEVVVVIVLFVLRQVGYFNNIFKNPPDSIYEQLSQNPVAAKIEQIYQTLNIPLAIAFIALFAIIEFLIIKKCLLGSDSVEVQSTEKMPVGVFPGKEISNSPRATKKHMQKTGMPVNNSINQFVNNDFETEIISGGVQTPYLTTEINGTIEKIYLNKPNFIFGRFKGKVDYVCQSAKVGKQHAQIINHNGRFFVTDLESKNGTYINNYQKRVAGGQNYPIADGDVIILADVAFTFHER